MPGSNRRDIIRDGEIATYHIWSQTAQQRYLLGRDWGLKELIARLANEESKTKGHFWAERFGSRELVDDEAILTCSMYIDVNQIKAGMAPSLLDSMHTAIRARIIEGRLQEAQAAIDMFREKEGDGLSLSVEEVQQMYLRCAWLAPVQTNGALKLVNDSWQSHVSPDQPVEPIPVLREPTGESDASRMEDSEPSDDSITEVEVEQASKSSSPRAKPTYEIHRRLSPTLPVRPSDSPFLAMPLDQYLLLARAAADRALEIRKSQMTGQKVRTWVPDELAAILHSRGIDSTAWYSTLDAFAERFHYVLGTPPHVEAFAARAGRQWVHGIGACRSLFRQALESPGNPGNEQNAVRNRGEPAMADGSLPLPDLDDSGTAAGGNPSGVPPVPR